MNPQSPPDTERTGDIRTERERRLKPIDIQCCELSVSQPDQPPGSSMDYRCGQQPSHKPSSLRIRHVPPHRPPSAAEGGASHAPYHYPNSSLNHLHRLHRLLFPNLSSRFRNTASETHKTSSRYSVMDLLALDHTAHLGSAIAWRQSGIGNQISTVEFFRYVTDMGLLFRS